MKYMVYLLNTIKSYFYDIRYYLFEDIQMRVNAINYTTYRATKLSPGYLKHGAKVEGIKYLAEKYCKGEGVDIGASFWTLPGARRVENNIQENAYKLCQDSKSLDYVFSSHLLEHLEQFEVAINEWSRTLKTDGILFMYLPHPSLPMWKKENLKYHVWNPDPYFLEDFFSGREDFELDFLTYQPDGYMSFVCICRKVDKE